MIISLCNNQFLSKKPCLHDFVMKPEKLDFIIEYSFCHFSSNAKIIFLNEARLCFFSFDKKLFVE